MHTISTLQNYIQSLSAYFIGISAHFLLYTTIIFMAGITWAHNGYNISLQIALVTAYLVTIITTQKQTKKQIVPALIFFSFYLGGFLYWYQIHKQEKFYLSIANQKIALKATVENIEAIENPRFNYRVSLCLIATKATNNFALCEKNLILLYVRELNNLQTGDFIQINTALFKKNSNENFNTYLLKEGHVASLFLEKFEYTVLNRPSWTINKIISDLKEYVLQGVAYKMNSDAFKLFSSLFLGNRTVVKREMENTKEYFKAWGISHYLARSGLHLVIFVLIWHFILGLVPISFFLKQFLIVILILVYALLSWSSVSFARALLMFLLYKFCLAHKVPIYYVHLITLATLIILLANPLELFFLDFQLSFGITFALAWFNSIQAEKRRLAI